ncbi:uncharacterized protein TRAVEDRAFT_23293 [Trametes versicolor FP-101664 SS1]|uniref:uncharacterized protein n=1 Tax=Trametes versicolor (strain FP-101664) TaxID=717944 RepID=UPI0004621A3A|nr:uncharacterized protein TRAVEDRAFT_23293 [Trametes versicolor FP-101664 SS1]EIW54072.1 hypothetical protein TRAVEDRAFT_23293 [Trametes versicolor FP-101664 SS1]
MPIAMSSLQQSPVVLSQAIMPAPSSSTTDQPSSRRHSIHVVIPPTHATVAHAALARTTPTAAAASDDEVLHAEWTPMHGHGAFVVPCVHDRPAPRIFARVQRRDSLFSVPMAADGVDVHAGQEAADAESDVGSREMSPAVESEGLELGEQGGNSDDGDRALAASAGFSVGRAQ